MGQYKLKSTIVIEIQTILNDEDTPTAETVEYMLREDIEDVGGWEITSIKTRSFSCEREDN